MDFRQLDACPQGPLANPCYGRWLSESGETLVQFFRSDDGFIVRFIDQADFAITTDCSSIVCRPTPEATPTAIAELFQNQVMPMILGHGGEIVIHASGVATQFGVLAFAGPTCRGKSTLAAALARRGFPLLTDDGLILNRFGDEYLVRPNMPGLRLRADSEAALFGLQGDARHDGPGKRRIAARDMVPFQQSPMRLGAIHLLGTGAVDTVEIAPIGEAEALSSLMNCCFILDAEDKHRLRAHFDRLADLVREVPCFSLDYPRDYAYLPEVAAAILDHAASGAVAT